MPGRQRVATQKDVARLADVSFITVSRVINDKGNVKPDTRERVLKAIKELNYYPNSFAQGLTANRVNTIAVMPHLSNAVGVEETSYYRRLLIGIEKYCMQAGFDILLSTQRERDEHFDFLRPYYQRKADGLILLGIDKAHIDYQKVLEDEIPCVIIGEHGTHPEICHLDSDNSWGTRLISEYLINHGHRRIAYLHVDRWTQDTTDRLESFKRILGERRIEFPEEYLLYGDFTMESGRTAARKIASMKNRPTAVIAATDLMALGLLEGASEVGLRIPEDLSIAGFDGHEITAYTNPPLATVVQDLEGMGYEAARSLIRQIHGEPLDKREIIFPVVFEPRGSIHACSSE